VAKLAARVPLTPERVKRAASALGERDVLTRLANVYSFFSADMKDALFLPSLKVKLAGTDDSRYALQRLQQDVAHLGPLMQMLYIDTRTNLPDDLLMVTDKMSMANSLEARVPFLDYRLVEFIERVPPALKLNGLTGKYLHKKALEKWLPRDRVWQKKKGFANPIEHWFRSTMRSFVDNTLLSPNAAVGQYFDRRYIRQLLYRDRLGVEQLRRQIYLLLSFELWHRKFIGVGR
jgi:asparagine synthase (glutamine-hydrolysing)